MQDFTLGVVGETNINREDPISAFADVKALFDKTNVLVGHVESPVMDNPSDDPMGKPDFTFKRGWALSKPNTLSAWKQAGFDAVGLASNVTGSTESTLRTLQELDALGLPHAGIGANIEEAHKPALFEKDGIRFGLLSYTSVYYPMIVAATATMPGAATARAEMGIIPSPRSLEMPGIAPSVKTWLDERDKAVVIEDIRNLKAKVDIVIVSCHWGVSDSEVTLEYQKELAHTAIDNGASVVFGHHPHRPQGIELYRDCPIFYSLGNFAFDWWFLKNADKKGYMAFVKFEDLKVTRVSFTPCWRRDSDNQIAPAAFDSAEGSDIYETVKRLSEPMGVGMSIEGEEVVIFPQEYKAPARMFG